jgi:lysophospholipid acyltransferase (LPLAT)-like uncharacterized protein
MSIIIRGITASMRIQREGFHHVDAIESSGRRAILAAFHGRQFLLPGCLTGWRITVMTSLSRDGELQARTLARFGWGIARGSASRSGARGLIGIRRFMEKGFNPIFAVDGPRGPLHEVKPGAVFLAKRTGNPVVPVTTSALPAHILKKTWDQYVLPLPFSRGAVLLGEPMEFDGDTSDEALSRDCGKLQAELLRLQERADGITGLKGKFEGLKV